MDTHQNEGSTETERAESTVVLGPTERRKFLAGAATLAGGAVLGTAVDLTRPAAASSSQTNSGRTPRRVRRTPDAQFHNLPDYPFAPHYVRIDAGDGSGSQLRVHYLDEQPNDPTEASGETILMLHGNPSWSYLYRHVIPPLVAGGHRCIAPDLVGFGRSDKPADRFMYTYQRHVDWLRATVLDRLDLRDVTLVCHDWGGKLGLRLLADHTDRFRRVVAINTGLETGEQDYGPAWPFIADWIQFTQRTHPLDVGQIVDGYTAGGLDPAVRAAYDAPYPDGSYKEGVRRFGVLIPISSTDENSQALIEAWRVLETVQTPFLCAFGEEDHIFHGNHSHLSGRIPGAQGQPHAVITGAAHFLQENKGPELAAVVDNFIRSTS